MVASKLAFMLPAFLILQLVMQNESRKQFLNQSRGDYPTASLKPLVYSIEACGPQMHIQALHSGWR